MEINIQSEKEERLKKALEGKNDPESKRLLRFLAMPDLSRTPGSPIYELVGRILKLKNFADFDIIRIPEIVPADVSFDLFGFPPNHPARSKSDTYYIDDQHILRTHTTVMWYYYLAQKAIKDKIKKGLPVGSLSYGKVYRKDEIDRHHMNVFHQMDGWYLCRKEEKIITTEDLQNVLADIARAVFGPTVKYRFNKDDFPYTDPSLEMEIERGNKWVEVLGSGVVRGNVLKNLGVDPNIYNGWAFGFGLERLAIVSMELPDIRLLWSEDERIKKQLRLGNKFREVSKFPPIVRDISFVVDKNFVPNNYFDLIRDLGGNLVEEVKLLDKYENTEKFGPNKVSYTYRIIYRSNERTLKNKEIDPIQDKIYQETKNQFGAEIR
jgi:phenylalanyl-tRNA synthetase alpha chain